MTYTRQQVLDHYNQARGTTFTLVTLAQFLLTQVMQNELAQMLRNDAFVNENSQIQTI